MGRLGTLGVPRAQLFLTALTLVAATLVALAVGFRPHAGVAGLAGMLGLCLLTGLTFTWVSSRSGCPQAASRQRRDSASW